MRIKPITISKGWRTCHKRKENKKPNFGALSKWHAERDSVTYCIDEVFLGGVKEEAGLESKSPEEDKQCHCKSWESSKEKEWE